MPAYVVVMREGPITNQAEYDEYVRIGRENPPATALKPLVIYGAMHALEGTPPDGLVIMEFPSVADAKAWYEGPYQAALPHRLASGDWRAVIVEGL